MNLVFIHCFSASASVTKQITWQSRALVFCPSGSSANGIFTCSNNPFAFNSTRGPFISIPLCSQWKTQLASKVSSSGLWATFWRLHKTSSRIIAGNFYLFLRMSHMVFGQCGLISSKVLCSTWIALLVSSWNCQHSCLGYLNPRWPQTADPTKGFIGAKSYLGLIPWSTVGSKQPSEVTPETLSCQEQWQGSSAVDHPATAWQILG